MNKRYIYTGELYIKELSVENILELIVASDELLLEELFDCAQDCLIKIRPTLVREELFLVLRTIFPLIKCKKLQDHCVTSISAELQSLNFSKEFLSLDKDILYELLKRDDLLIEEAIIWDYLIKWGIEQTSGLGSEISDGTKWNNENYEALKETLSRFIPLIRFTEISPDDFLDKIRPFEAIIPHNIYEEIMEFHIKRILPTDTITLPPRVGTIEIESKIIKPKLAYIMAKWIEKKDATVIRSRNSQYKFNLLYRSSQDNLYINSFQFKCESSHGPCFILIKPKSNANGWAQPRRNEFSNGSSYRVPNIVPRHLGWNSRNIAAQSAQRRIHLAVLAPRNASFFPQQTSWNNHASQQTLSQNLTKIYGEYYSRELNDVWYTTTDNFIFSFANDDDTKNMKVCCMNHHNDNMIIFGFSFKISRRSLYINNSLYNDNNVLNSCMSMPVPEEIEIFEIIPNDNGL
jgi:hypothetical protein